MTSQPRPLKGQRITDARRRVLDQLDPVKLYLLQQSSVIPAETLKSIAEELLPGARRQRISQMICMALSLLVVVGGTIVYFKYFSTWKGFDPVNLTIYTLQLAIIVAGPLIAVRIARSRYADRVAGVMLTHRRCPHCGYDIRQLPTATDGTTVCPECGSAWKLTRPPTSPN